MRAAPASLIRYRIATLFLGSLIGTLVCQNLAFAQNVNCTELAELSRSDAAPGEYFGLSVALRGDTALVGAMWDNCLSGFRCGSAYVFRRHDASWVQEQKFFAPIATPEDRFGGSVSLSGDFAFIGASYRRCSAPVSGDRCGAAFVYRFNGVSWIYFQTLVSNGISSSDYFGSSVAVQGNTAFVGAKFEDCPNGEFGCGAVYEFRFNGTSWVEHQRITSPIAGESSFGGVVAFDGDVLVSHSSGPKVHVFRFDQATWNHEQSLLPTDIACDFGHTLSVQGDKMIIGAKCFEPAGDDWGGVYAFRFDGSQWVEEPIITLADPVASRRYINSVVMSNDLAIVNADLFRYDGSAWIEDVHLADSDGQLFPYSGSAEGSTFLLGAPLEDCAAGFQCGEVFAYNCVSTVPAFGRAAFITFGIALVVVASGVLEKIRKPMQVN